MCEPPVIRSLDFSQFHPLGHSLWACRGWPGGRRRHLQYRWRFQWRARCGLLFCWLGRHDPVQWWDRHGFPGGTTCNRCDEEISD